MSFLQISGYQNSKKRASLQPGFSFGSFLKGDFKCRKTEDPLYCNLQRLLTQLIEKIEARGGLLSYHKSGIQTTISAGKTDAVIAIDKTEQEQLKNGKTVMQGDAYVHPIHSNNYLEGIIYIYKPTGTWKPLSEDLVHAYALLSEQNLQMQHKQESLSKYADSLVEKKKELEKIQEYNQNLLSITTHDLSSPLNAVAGYLDMVDEYLQTDTNKHKIQEYYRNIQSGVNDVSDMLKQLNEVIKFKKGFLTLDTVTVDVNWIIKDICELLRATAEQKNIELKAITAAEPLYIDVDIVKFKRIIYNLVSNAIKYTGRAKHIYVHISAGDGNVRIHVKDQGIGISEDKLDKIFEPFVKLNSKDTDVYSQGLGLYISSYFVELMGGEIIAQSKTGKGSTFTITMPRVAVSIPQSQAG